MLKRKRRLKIMTDLMPIQVAEKDGQFVVEYLGDQLCVTHSESLANVIRWLLMLTDPIGVYYCPKCQRQMIYSDGTNCKYNPAVWYCTACGHFIHDEEIDVDMLSFIRGLAEKMEY